MMTKMGKWATMARSRAGQGMTEYIIIVGVIAVLMIIVVNKYGKELAGLFSASTDEIKTTADTVGGAADAAPY